MIRHRLFLILLGVIICRVLFSQTDIQQKIGEYELLVSKYKQSGNLNELVKCQSKLGYLYWEAGNTQKAIDNFEVTVQNLESSGNQNAIRTLSSNIGVLCTEKGDYEKALTYLNKSLQINQKLRKRGDIASDYMNISIALQGLKRYDESNTNISKALPIFQELDDLRSMRSGYQLLSENYDKLGERDKAKENFDIALLIAKKLQKEELDRFEARAHEAELITKAKERQLRNTIDTLKEVKHISSQKQTEIDLLSKARELDSLKHEAREHELAAREEQRKNIILTLGSIILVIVIVSTLILRQLKAKKKANKLLEQRNQQIIEQKKQLEAQHEIVSTQKKKITDSIYYAQRIQQAILPTKEEFEKAFPEHFVLFKPRDIVSGDFYWMAEKDGIIIIAAADCTGHGVPGAFMSMLGIAYLNEIIGNIGINKHIRSLHASDILNNLREHFIQALHQTGELEETKDGMEISLCIIDTDNRSLQFAGAHNPIYIVRNDELIKFEPDKMPIGIWSGFQSFTNREFALEHGDMIYLFSDGYYDQFGGPKGLKYFSANFRKLLLDIYKLPPREQLGVLEHTIEEWKGNREQIDDMMVIGLRIILDKEPLIASTRVSIKKRILIAEDTELNYYLLLQALRNYDVKIYRASNGKEAVDFCKANPVDLILMDINMPVMDGEEATKLIRGFNTTIPIIAQTALDLPGQKEHLLEIGCNDYISKPIDLQLFISIIKKYIEI